jgi:hypothetical protein
MKQKKSSPSKPKLSFTVDRSEFDISSDWVQAVMRPPSLPAAPSPFFSPDINNATGVSSATAEQNDSVAEITPAAINSGVAEISTVVETTTDKTGEIATVANITTLQTVEYNPPVEHNATVVAFRSPWKLRPLRRITDGLTPGQYAVYSLMFENADAGEGGERLYRGGYADIGRLTGLSKRGIQNVIGELQEKGVIRLHRAPGHHRLQTSAYIVPNPDSVLAVWSTRGWRFAFGKSKRLTDGATVALLATPGAA